MATITQIQGNPDVVLQTSYPSTNLPAPTDKDIETPAVNAAYNNGASTVRVVGSDNVTIGGFPRPRPQ